MSLLLGCPALAQKEKKDTCHAGVYITESDFLNYRLSHKIRENSKGYKFGLSAPADLKLEIRIEKPDTVLKYKAGSAYGFAECGKNYRYFKGDELDAPDDFYRVEETAGLVIYTSALVTGNEHYYSLSRTGKIRRLRIKNLEEDFKHKPEFIEAAKELNKKPEIGNLAKRDENGRFIINKIYTEKVK